MATTEHENEADRLADPICNIITPVGMLGYGLDESITATLISAALRNGAPTAISTPDTPTHTYAPNQECLQAYPGTM